MKGSVLVFHRNRGFGFIKPEEGKKVFVHHEDIISDDPWPFIKRGTKVEFELKEENGKQKAKSVTLEGGEKIPLYFPSNSDRVANDDDIYSGAIKFFESRKGYGIIIPDSEITWDGTTSTDGVYFSRASINTTGAAKGMVLSLRPGTKVTFKVYKDKKKSLGAHEVQNEDGNPIEYEARKPRKGRKRKRISRKRGGRNKKAKVPKKSKEELLEEREIDEEENLYTGTFKFYKTEKEYGFITIEEDITFNDATAKDAIYVLKEDIVCRSEEVGLNEGKKVVFKVYKDSMGLGACEVQNEDGTPIVFEQQEVQSEEDVKAQTSEPEATRRRSKRITKKN
jgi:cold shock CspA family protein